MKAKKDSLKYQGLGRRKSSVARVTLIPNGKGTITINGRDINEYFPYKTLVQDAEQGLVITKTKGTVDIIANINGGGFTGQAGALRLGIVRALLQASSEYRKELKKAGLITRDPRAKERKKPGLKAARRGPQYSKR